MKVIIYTLPILFLLLISSASAEIVAYYPLNETSGSTVYDLSGKGNNGTISGGVTLGVTGLKSNSEEKAAGFDGIDSQINLTLNNETNFNSTDPWTIEFLIKPTVDRSNCIGDRYFTIFSKTDPDDNNQGYAVSLRYDCNLNQTRVHTDIIKDGSNNISVESKVDITNGFTYYVTITYNGSQTSDGVGFKLNGHPIDERSSIEQINNISDTLGQNDTTTSKKAVIGGANGLSRYFNGTLQELRIYNEVLEINTTRENAFQALKRISEYTPATQSIPIIFDTDFDSDVDDVLDLVMLHKLMDKGEINLTGVIVTSENQYSAGAAVVINYWYGRQNLTVGQYHGSSSGSSESTYTETLVNTYDDFPDKNESSDFEDSNITYRRLLANSTNGTVVIITSGGPSSLSDLLKTQPDEISNLNGTQLVEAKVKLLITTIGIHPDSISGITDSSKDPTGMSYLINNWPKSVPILWNGVASGLNQRSGQYFMWGTLQDSPVKLAIKTHLGTTNTGNENPYLGKKMFTQYAALLATRGFEENYYTPENNGSVYTDGIIGRTTFNRSVNNNHSYLSIRTSNYKIDKIVNNILPVDDENRTEKGQYFNYTTTPLGVSLEKKINLTNYGTTPITVNSVTVPDGFTVTQSLSSVGSGDTSELIIKAKADLQGYYNGTVRINTSVSLLNEETYEFPISVEVTSDNSSIDELYSLIPNIRSNVTQQDIFFHINITNETPYNSLQIYYPFDANTSSTTAFDYTMNEMDSTYNGNARYNNSGVYGGGAYLDGTGDYLDPSSITLTNRLERSASLWVWTTSSATTQRVFASGDAVTAGNDFTLQIFSGGIRGIVGRDGDGGNQLAGSSATLSSKTWTHVALVFNSTNLTIYINGEVAKSDSDASVQNVSTSEEPWIIGSKADLSGENFNGYIDEFMLFNTSLTEDQVSQIYNNQSSRFYPNGQLDYLEKNLSSLGYENKLNLTIQSYQSLMNSSIQIRIDNGSWISPDNNGKAYDINLTNAERTNISLKFLAGNSTNYFYTPLLLGNITLTSYTDDTTPPSVIILYPTNNSELTFSDVVNVSINLSIDDSSGISSYWYNIDDGSNTTFDGSNLTLNFSLSAGESENHLITVYANDSLNNINSSSVYITITKESSTSNEVESADSDESSGTTLSKFWRYLQIESEKNLKDKGTIKLNLREKERVKIKINNTIHHVGITSLKNNTATIEVSSEPQKETLMIGESKKFEVTEDNYYDLIVQLNSIGRSKSSIITLANVNISYLHEKIPIDKETKENKTEREKTNKIIEEKPKKSVNTKIYETIYANRLWITITIVIVIMALTTVLILKERPCKHRKRRV